MGTPRAGQGYVNPRRKPAIRRKPEPLPVNEADAPLEYHMAKLFGSGPRGRANAAWASTSADELIDALIAVPAHRRTMNWQGAEWLVGDYLTAFGREIGEPALLAAVKRRRPENGRPPAAVTRVEKEVRAALMLRRDPGVQTPRGKGERPNDRPDGRRRRALPTALLLAQGPRSVDGGDCQHDPPGLLSSLDPPPCSRATEKIGR